MSGNPISRCKVGKRWSRKNVLERTSERIERERENTILFLFHAHANSTPIFSAG